MSVFKTEKDTVQFHFPAVIAQCPIGVYTHRKGGEYVVFNHSVSEDDLAILVHYYSISEKTRWTRTVANFVEEVEGKPRFVRKRDATLKELLTADGWGGVWMGTVWASKTLNSAVTWSMK